jgi:prepilin-type N-terminal cleavage/methylation domain-containing protein
MKKNNRGFTLIESIVTIAMIAILLSAVALAFTSIIRYMSESAYIKNTSNELFEKIQNNEGEETNATMVFSDSVSVDGVKKTVTEHYNDKDELFLSSFNYIEEYKHSAWFYLLKDPSQQYNEIITPDSTDTNSNLFWLNKMGAEKNIIKENTHSSTDINYILSRVKKFPSKDSMLDIETILDFYKDSYYKDVTYEQANVVWYKIEKRDDNDFNIFGIVLPFKVKEDTINVTFVREGKSITVPISRTSGMSLVMKEYVKNQLGFTDEGNQWICAQINKGVKFKLSELLSPKMFVGLDGYDSITITHK